MAKRGSTSKRKAAETDPAPFSGDPRHVSICFNRTCADYGRERPAGEPCGCVRKTSVREPMLSIDIDQ
jgi:hypothetical protein